MKPLLLAAAVLLFAPAAAHAQVAAGALPNTFDRPAMPVQAVEPVSPAPAAAPLNPAAEDTLRKVIAGAQTGAIDYTLMTDDLAEKVREQEATVTPLIQGFGVLVAVDFLGSQEGMDGFAVTFAEAATEWMIALNDEGKITGLLFRPAE
ncbi:MAG: hypothetical protein KKG14_07905 [Alphaproteobacteria bacterium]|nr:hypothetical protein [Alphaproteobacteria bacterium]MBU2418612.1 hypothetical protein [Alphaproteobacteria bacterium]